jgi:hypothetical protein
MQTLKKQKYKIIGFGSLVTGLWISDVIYSQRKLRGLQFYSHKIKIEMTENQIIEENLQSLLVNRTQMSNQEKIIKHIKTFFRLCSIMINFLPVIFVSCLRYIFYYLPIVSQKTMDSLLQDMIVIAIENSGSLFVCIIFLLFTIRMPKLYLDKRSAVSVS